MPDNLLQICKNVSDELQLESPVSIIGSPNETSRIFRWAARHSCEAISRRPETHWKALIREHTFNTVIDEPAYDLPTDFKYFVDQTMWDRANYWEMRGPLTQAQWQLVKSSVLGDANTVRRRFQLRSDGAATNPKIQFNIHPTPTVADDEIVFEYVTTGWAKNATTGAVQETWLQDTDLPLLDQYLIELDMAWRVLFRLGMAYEEEKMIAEDEIDKAIARDGAAPILSTSPRPDRQFLDTNNIPDSGFGVPT